jgi:hypothetical protein
VTVLPCRRQGTKDSKHSSQWGGHGERHAGGHRQRRLVRGKAGKEPRQVMALVRLVPWVEQSLEACRLGSLDDEE